MKQSNEAEEMLIEFSKLLRKTLSRFDEFITLQSEMEIVDNNIKLQTLRYKEELKIQYELEPTTLYCLVPSFILQPLVENAIFYNAGMNRDNEIKISSEINHLNNQLTISVCDRGVGMSTQQIQQALHTKSSLNKVGLKNVNARIQIYYGLNYGLEIKSSVGEGTTIVVKLPFVYT